MAGILSSFMSALYTCSCSTFRDQKRESDPLELEFQAELLLGSEIDSEAEPEPFGRLASALSG